jgi:hypothetical protein
MKITILTILFFSLNSFAETDIKNLILKHKENFAKKLDFSTSSVIAEDELHHCYGYVSPNNSEHIIGTCYLNENGSTYLLAITEELSLDFKFSYPVFKTIILNQEL